MLPPVGKLIGTTVDQSVRAPRIPLLKSRLVAKAPVPFLNDATSTNVESATV